MRALLVCLLLVACGDDDDDTPAIDGGGPAVDGGNQPTIDSGIDGGIVFCPAPLGSCQMGGGRCIDVFAPPEAEKNIEANCEQDKGSNWVSGDTCAAVAAVGTCSLSAGGACQTVVYTKPYTTETATADCEQIGGQFQPPPQ